MEEGTRPAGIPGAPDRGRSPDGWATVKDAPSDVREGHSEEAGWTFFFMAGEIKTTVFGFDRQKALRAALKRLLTDVKSQHCNSIEITQVLNKSFLGVPYVSVLRSSTASAEGHVFFRLTGQGSDPALISQVQS